jgi:PhzF family phenazine biosynthesis protein
VDESVRNRVRRSPEAPTAHYRVRIFTPKRELPFAGHPTIGTAHAVLEARIAEPSNGLLRQECGAGVLTLAVEGKGAERRIAVEAPMAKLVPVDLAVCGRVWTALGVAASGRIDPKIVDVGPRWLTLELADERGVRDLKPDLPAIAALSRDVGVTGVTVFGRASGAEYALVVRSFAPAEGVPEDPVCGSGNAAVGSALDAVQAVPGIGHEYITSQGRELGRDGYVLVRIDPVTRRTWIAGHAVTCINGALHA